EKGTEKAFQSAHTCVWAKIFIYAQVFGTGLRAPARWGCARVAVERFLALPLGELSRRSRD
ncbi:MAG: hypothetical protein ACI4LE_06665, partial [Faecalibacterium sp.]